MTEGRMSWNAPESRFFDVGLDRGVLYPRKPPVPGPILATNLATNPRGTGENSLMQPWVHINEFPDPFFVDNVVYDLTPHNGTTRYVTTPSDDGATFGTAVVQVNDVPESNLSLVIWGAMDEGSPISAKIRIRLKPELGGVRSMSVRMTAYDSAKSNPQVLSDSTKEVVLTNNWSDISLTSTDLGPSGAAYVGVELSTTSATSPWATSTDGYEIDAISISKSPSPPPFISGDMEADDEFEYFWLGNPYDSPSIASATPSIGWSARLADGKEDHVTKAPGGGVNVRSKDGLGANHAPFGDGEIGKYYSARFKIRRLPGEVAEAGVYISAYLYVGNTIAEPVDWDGDLGGLPEDGSPRIVNLVSTEPTSTSAVPSLQLVNERYARANYNVDELHIEEVSGPGIQVQTDFFDGDSQPDSSVLFFEWAGVPYQSVSNVRALTTAAVPWNGLTAVDEEGGDGAASYYIDGRPFLFLPRPKEYKASLKAYTYPDAFSEIMGVAEIADGMYLDSQLGDVFDFSYRTLVGNGVDGVDHGYKIHLVYNATVAPQALNYESMSNSINPSTFSWEIQAVPVRVDGFRPTAHIIIDTRHMEQSKIEAIENLLYGSSNDLAHMPSPQVVFDTLSFGDTIIVTDNGDGTFDVTGSYENVYMISDGVFRVENVDGTNNNDGTFTISSTISASY